jgi:hypothetical protein
LGPRPTEALQGTRYRRKPENRLSGAVRWSSAAGAGCSVSAHTEPASTGRPTGIRWFKRSPATFAAEQQRFDRILSAVRAAADERRIIGVWVFGGVAHWGDTI